MKKRIRLVPNALSIARIVLSAGLLFLTKWPWIFSALYLVTGLTDVLDGRIARRFSVESALGSKLDAAGDTMLLLAALASMFFLARLEIELVKCLAVVSVGLLYKLVNLFLVRVRFKTWNMMHTLMNKTVGVAVFFYVPVFLILGKVNFYMVLAMSVLIALTCIEETITLLRCAEFDADHKGIFWVKVTERLKRRTA